MNHINQIRGAAIIVLVVVALSAGYRAFHSTFDSEPASRSFPPSGPDTFDAHPSFLYGRVTTDEGEVYEGRIRFGGDEEAFWGNYFNGYKDHNPWESMVPADELVDEGQSVGIFGLKVFRADRKVDLGRPFMARLGDIERIEAFGESPHISRKDGIEFDPDVRVTLKSGATFDLDRLEAGDFDDGVRVWDETRGVQDIGTRRIRSIEFRDSGNKGKAPNRLYGTVHSLGGEFTGFLQWDREQTLGSDELVGGADGNASRIRFDAIQSIVRRTENSSLVMLQGVSEVVLSNTRSVGRGNRGVYVDDARYGRVLVSWDAFQRVDFSDGGAGPSYDDFPAGHLLRGTVLTRDGRRLGGRLVYDLDESQSTETLDAPFGGVDYTIPLGRVSSIDLGGDGPARVVLRGGEELALERSGDLGDGNGGMLVFVAGHGQPEYIRWADVRRIDFDAPAAE